MMQCQDIDELMVDFLYQELDGPQSEAFRTHVDSCARCGAELKSLQQMRQALRAMPEAEPSVAVTSRLLHEAAKRARPAEESGGILAWFTKLLSPVMAHPAWAAVGMLVLVAGVAGVMTMTGRVNEHAPAIEVSTTTKAEAPASPPAPEAARAAHAAGAPESSTRTALDQEGDRQVDAFAGKTVAPSKPVVRPVDQPEPPKDYASKVAPPAVTAAPKPSIPKAKAAEPSADLKDADLARGGRLGSASENELMKTGEKKAATESNRRDEVDDGALAEKKPVEQKLAPQPSAPAAAEPSPPPPPPAEERAQQQGYAAAPAGEGAAASRQEKQAEKQKEEAPQRKMVAKPDSNAAGNDKGNAGPGQAAAGKVAPATSAPAAAPEVVQDARQRENTKEPPEQQLLVKARKSATTGNCGEALTISNQIARMNPEFHRKRVAGDASIRACQLEAEKRRKAPAQMRNADEIEAAPATKDTAK